MRRLIHYGHGVVAAAGAEFLLVYMVQVHACGSFACAPYVHIFRTPTGWDILFGAYFIGIWSVVGGLLSLAVGVLLKILHSWRLSFLQGIIVMLAPLAVRNLLSSVLVIDIAVWAAAGAVGALLALGLYTAGSLVARRAIVWIA